jgi:DNA invertase Pin-like site-specific DNA recombinase/DNA-binding CsgD family transcriptional regulator
MRQPAKLAAIYVRVSSEEQVQGYSLSAQERAAEAYCTAHGWDIVGIYRDEGRSARTDNVAKRPSFASLLDDADAGHFDVIVVHKNDRFARNRRIAFETFDRLARAGIGFVSIAENMDYSTPAGQLMLTMLVGLNQFYSDNLSLETKKGKHERKAQGLYNGLLPFGVVKNAQGTPVLDMDARYCDVTTRTEIATGNGLTYAFELARAGKTDREIAQALNAAGYWTTGNRGMNRFQKDSVRVMLRNRFYVGDLPDGRGGWVPGRHGALIDPDLFDAAQTARERNTLRPRRVAGVRSPWSLSGLAVCAGCGKPVTADGKHRARCQGRTQGNGGEQPSFSQALIDDQLTFILSTFDIAEDQRGRLLAAWRHSQSRHVDTAASRLRIQRKLDRLKVLFLDGDLTTEKYRAQKDALTGELASLPPVGNPDSDAGARLAAYLADVSRAWTDATPEERNKLARSLFASVVVDNKQAAACVPRPELEPFFRTVAVNPASESCKGGSDGDRLHEMDAFESPLVPILYPEYMLRSRNRRGAGRYAAGTRHCRISEEQLSELVTRAKSESLRSIARDLGVSHETVRAALRTADVSGRLR